MIGELECSNQDEGGKPQSGQCPNCRCHHPGPDKALHILALPSLQTPASLCIGPTTTHSQSSEAEKLFSKTRTHSS